MRFLLVFGIVLLAAVAVSERARRTVLSTSVLFLATGLLAGPGATDLLGVGVDTEAVSAFVELALIVVLLTDGSRLHVRQALERWTLPLRALLVGLPLTLALAGTAAHLLAGLPWAHALLLGAVLSPTDPVLSEAIVGRDEVPERLRRFLNVESGLNDGLALPFVLVLLATASDQPSHPWTIVRELATGAGLGVLIPLIASWVLQRRAFGVAARYEPLAVPAIATIAIAGAAVAGGNLFLAAFLCGITLRTVAAQLVDAFTELGDALSETIKLAALLVFGVVFSASLFSHAQAAHWLFVLFVLVVARPLALLVAIVGRRVDWPLFAAAAWFGPKGFATVTFALLALKEDLTYGARIFHLAGLVVTASIVAHSSTDTVIARRFERSLDTPP